MRTTPLLALCLACLAAPALASQATLDSAARAGSPSASSQGAAGVREAERLRAQALTERDVDALRRLLGGDYYHVETNGRVRTKSEFLQALARDEYRIRNYGVEEMEIRFAGDGGTAIVTGTYRVVATDQPATPQRGRYVRVWTRSPDGWRATVHQGTQIRPVPAGPMETRTVPLQ